MTTKNRTSGLKLALKTSIVSGMTLISRLLGLVRAAGLDSRLLPLRPLALAQLDGEDVVPIAPHGRGGIAR